MLLAALVLAQLLPIQAEQIPFPSPAPTSAPTGAAATPAPTQVQRRDVVDVELGGSNSYLNDGRGPWESGYARATFAAPSGFKLHLGAANDVRFGSSTDVYALTADIPTNRPHGVLDFGYVLSSKNSVLPSNAWIAGYDLRTGGGGGYQFGYVDRSFSTASAASYTLGTDKRFLHQRIGYFIAFSTLSKKKSGVGVLQGLRWSSDAPMDTVTLTAGAGRGVESTGPNKVAVHDLLGFDADELHWLDARTAIRLDTGYFSVSKAYQRFLVLLGLRVRI